MPVSVLDRFKLDGRTALVASSGTGIGLGIARALFAKARQEIDEPSRA